MAILFVDVAQVPKLLVHSFTSCFEGGCSVVLLSALRLAEIMRPLVFAFVLVFVFLSKVSTLVLTEKLS